jgi:Holliday junction resolvasome RuvABC endonuclease subunit
MAFNGEVINYIFALDLSISCTGVSIFEESSRLVLISHIKTNPKDSHGVRLKNIAEYILDLRKCYPSRLAIIERAFSQHNISTQVLYRVHGLINYLFYDCEQIYYAPTSVKQTITGNGKASKEELKNVILEKYPNIKFKNNDESDSVAIGLTYFIKNNIRIEV